MEFDVSTKKIAGSANAILSNPDVAKVYGHFGDKILFQFGIDIRTKKTFMSAQVLRQVQSFIEDYGVDDSLKIINELFSPKRKGKLKGRAVGASLFAKNMRWYADQLMLEGGGDDKPDTSNLGFWDR